MGGGISSYAFCGKDVVDLNQQMMARDGFVGHRKIIYEDISAGTTETASNRNYLLLPWSSQIEIASQGEARVACL